ncbi:phenylalanine--tRNA ligase subunit beta [Candidatus Parvarchaeota archaeon]|jgi:phenylalanyl-tRNA synthetase beta chain|nr:phenylalanine--tRNA ligase subunit beta [Candidatus Parvarchaeota archaeon]
MVMLNYSLDEMNEALGKKLKITDYERIALRFGLDLDVGEDMLDFELTSDRTDIVSKYSLAQIFASQLGIKIKRHVSIGREKPGVLVEKTAREFVNLIHVVLDDRAEKNLSEILAIQERLDKNVGRNRKKSAIGLFDYEKIAFPITYREIGKDKVEFIPLGYSSSKNYDDIIRDVKQAIEYRQLIPRKPIAWLDSSNNIIAMPPIINADRYSVTADTKELLIDVTGPDRETVNAVTKILMYNFQFLGKVSIIAASYKNKAISTGFSIDTHGFYLNEDSIKSVLGNKISQKQAVKILSASDYTVKTQGKDIFVKPPFYRQDVMHQVDIIDDIMRAFGVDNITETIPHTYTEGSFLPNHYFVQNIKEILIGFGYQEIDINALTNEKYQFLNTFINGEDYVSLLQLKSGDVTMASRYIFPELLRLISNNLHKKFPQKIFSLSEVVQEGESDVTFENRLKLSLVSCEKDANVTDVLSIIKKVLADSFMTKDISTGYVSAKYAKTFINGRAYTLIVNGKEIGFAGEVHPRVLNSFGIELPVSLAEIYIDGFTR